MLFGVYKAPEPLMSSDPNKRNHFRYHPVFSVSCRVLFQNFVRILKLYRIASERVTIVVRNAHKYINCECDSIPFSCNPDTFLATMYIFVLLWWCHVQPELVSTHHTECVELNM